MVTTDCGKRYGAPPSASAVAPSAPTTAMLASAPPKANRTEIVLVLIRNGSSTNFHDR